MITDLLRDPAQVEALSEQAREAVVKEAAAQIAQLAALVIACQARPSAGQDRMLMAPEAAAMLGVKVNTLWWNSRPGRRWAHLRLNLGSQTRRFSYQRIQEYLRGIPAPGGSDSSPASGEEAQGGRSGPRPPSLIRQSSHQRGIA